MTANRLATASTLPRNDAPPSLARPGFLTLLAILDLLGGAFLGLVGLGVTAVAARGGSTAVLVVGLPLLFAGMAHVACAGGLFTLAPWSRRAQIFLSVLWLAFVPLGTVAGIAVLIYLTRPGARLILGRLTVDELGPEDHTDLARLPGFGRAAIIALGMAAGLAVVAIPIVGIISAIAVPNLLHAIQRGKQKRTMADIRGIAVALEAYAEDHRSYPDADSIERLVPLLVPDYIPSVPLTDAWERKLRARSGTGPQGPSYVIASAGKDGAWEQESLLDYDAAESRSLDADIVFSDGAFVRHPPFSGAGLSPAHAGDVLPAERDEADVEPPPEDEAASEMPDPPAARVTPPPAETVAAAPEPAAAPVAAEGETPPPSLTVADREKYESYTIKTKDGEELTVPWFEIAQGKVLITMHGGEFGIAEESVVRIDGRPKDDRVVEERRSKAAPAEERRSREVRWPPPRRSTGRP